MSTALRRAAVGASALLVTLALVSVFVVACTGDDGGELSVDDFCEEIVVIQTLDAQLGQIETLEVEATFADLQDLTERAPEEIRPSLEVLTDYTGQVVAALAPVDPGDVEGADEALATAAISEDDRVAAEAAGREVEIYAQDNCRLDLRTGGTLPPATTPPPTTGPPASGAPESIGPPETTAAPG